MSMIFRFSLYGFLKNQQYYEPFLFLAFLEKGLSFLEIGILIGFREICINAFEIPSGALADLWGRRRTMILALTGYIVSFIVFGFSRVYWTLFAAMLFFAVGEAFRTGTHKAIILNWLELNNRRDERTRVYGITRSWAQVGSAASVLIAAALVFYRGRYSAVFLFCIIPYLLGLVNLFLYPKELEGAGDGRVSFLRMIRLTGSAFAVVLRRGRLRRLLFESLGFQGLFKVSKDYLQPVLRALALGLPVMMAFEDKERAALVVGAVYFVLYALNSVASWKSERVARLFGKDDCAARSLWGASALSFAALGAALWFDRAVPAVVVFVLVATLHNFWRPLQIGRLGAAASTGTTATILSIESQSVSAFVAVVAPLLGWWIDALKQSLPPEGAPHVVQFYPVAVVGCAVSAAALLLPHPEPEAE